MLELVINHYGGGNIMDKAKTCCVIGGAEKQNITDGQQEQFMFRTKGELLRLYRQGVRTFLCGMAVGAETAAAEVVLALRDSTLSDLRLVGILAWEERTNNWSESDRDRFFAVMERCDEEIMLQTAYTEGALERQREYLLQNSEYRLFAE